MKYSVFTVCMPEHPLETVPKLLAQWGYDGVEWRVTDQRKAAKPSFWAGNHATVLESEALGRAKEIKKLCRDAGITIMALGTYCSCESKSVPYLMEVARAMGTRNIRVGPPHYDGSKSYNRMFAKAQKDYAKVERYAEKFGVRANVEMHPNTLTASASASARFLEPFNPKHVGAIYDVGNQVREGFEHFRAGLEILGKYLSHVHMKNGIWKKAGKDRDGATMWVPKGATLKAGQLDIAQFMDILVQQGYKGWISLEDFTPGSSERRLTDAIKYLKTLEKRALRKKK